MPRSETYSTIVLQVHDVGEADRFCILLTRERGKLAARARGVRKLQSRMGGSILPLRRGQMTLHDGSAGFLITAVQDTAVPNWMNDVEHFYRAQQAVELLLCLLHDDEPVPEVYDALQQMLTVDQHDQHIALAFTIHLLDLLGLMPAPNEGKFGAALTDSERAFVESSIGTEWMHPPALEAQPRNRLQKLTSRILDQQTSRTLRAGSVVCA